MRRRCSPARIVLPARLRLHSLLHRARTPGRTAPLARHAERERGSSSAARRPTSSLSRPPLADDSAQRGRPWTARTAVRSAGRREGRLVGWCGAWWAGRARAKVEGRREGLGVPGGVAEAARGVDLDGELCGVAHMLICGRGSAARETDGEQGGVGAGWSLGATSAASCDSAGKSSASPRLGLLSTSSPRKSPSPRCSQVSASSSPPLPSLAPPPAADPRPPPRQAAPPRLRTSPTPPRPALRTPFIRYALSFSTHTVTPSPLD